MSTITTPEDLRAEIGADGCWTITGYEGDLSALFVPSQMNGTEVAGNEHGVSDGNNDALLADECSDADTEGVLFTCCHKCY